MKFASKKGEAIRAFLRRAAGSSLITLSSAASYLTHLWDDPCTVLPWQEGCTLRRTCRMGGCKVEKYFVTRSVILEDSWCIRSGRVSTSWGPVLRPPLAKQPPQATPKLPRRQGSSPNAAGKSQAGKMSLRDRERERGGRGRERETPCARATPLAPCGVGPVAAPRRPMT